MEAMRVNESVCELNLASIEGLNRNNLQHEAIEDLPLIYSMKVSTLCFLDLSGNGLTDRGALTISNALVSNKALLSLKLSENEITDEGMSTIIEQLPQTKLRWLDISRNAIKDKGMTPLCDVLQRGRLSLESLNISECGFER